MISISRRHAHYRLLDLARSSFPINPFVIHGPNINAGRGRNRLRHGSSFCSFAFVLPRATL
jgi:hypothetical protein